MYKVILISLLTTGLISCGDSEPSTTPNDVLPPMVIEKPQLPDTSLAGKIEEIATFLQLTNQVRYFHPSTGAALTNWDKFTSYGIYRIAKSSNQEEFIATLRELFSTVSPNLKINGQGSAEVEPIQDGDMVTYWLQNGYVEKQDMSSSVYRREKETGKLSIARSEYNIETNFKASLSTSITIDLPIVLAVKGGVTLPESKALTEGIQDYDIKINFTNPYARIAAAGQLWAVLQHFYPYLDELDLNWSDELLPLVEHCTYSSASCELAMHSLLTKTGDNHNWLYSVQTSLNHYTVPVNLGLLENKIIVIDKTEQSSAINIGDQLIAVDGIEIDSLIAEQSPFSLRAKNKQRLHLVAYKLLRGQQNSQTTLTLKGLNTTEYQITLSKTESAKDMYVRTRDILSYANTDKHRVMNNNIHYVNISALEATDVVSTIKLIEGAKAIVLDLRTYPNWESWRPFISHFSDSAINSLPMTRYQYFYPNQQGNLLIDIPQRAMPSAPFIDVPVVVLSSLFSISQNEHALGYVQDANIPIMGESTYGINGDLTFIHLLGGLDNDGVRVIFTGTKVTQHDGSLLRGVGIQPDIEVPVTIDAMTQRRDIQLATAVQYLQQQISQ